MQEEIDKIEEKLTSITKSFYHNPFAEAKRKMIQLFSHSKQISFDPDMLFLAGGAIVSTTLEEPVKDYDFFCRTRRDAERVRREFEALGVGEHGPLKVLSITDNAVSFTHTHKEYPYYQIITRTYGSPQSVVETFDLIHTMAYYTFIMPIVTHKDFSYVVAGKLLKPNPLCKEGVQAGRLDKFISKGWRIEDDTDIGLKLLRELDEFQKKKQENPDFVTWPES